MIGRVDGTAAVDGDRGFVFLFNPNYRRLDAVFALDASIGLTTGEGLSSRSSIRKKGGSSASRAHGIWRPGDQVVLPMRGTEAVRAGDRAGAENIERIRSYSTRADRPR